MKASDLLSFFQLRTKPLFMSQTPTRSSSHQTRVVIWVGQASMPVTEFSRSILETLLKARPQISTSLYVKSLSCEP